MADLNGFDADTVEPTTDFETIPAGKYEAVITESEFKPTKAGTGNYLQLTFQVIAGPYKNRFLWAPVEPQQPQRHGSDDCSIGALGDLPSGRCDQAA